MKQQEEQVKLGRLLCQTTLEVDAHPVKKVNKSFSIDVGCAKPLNIERPRLHALFEAPRGS